MAKAPTLTTVSTGYNSSTKINDNMEAITEAFENTLSLDGSTPNAMGADLDLNDNDILNATNVYTDNMYVAGTKVTSSSAVPTWMGAWVTATAYGLDQLVSESGNTYICIVAHTSGTFATDLAAVKWALVAQKGTTGAGTGDLLAANNLSDLGSAATSRTNLGVEIGVDVQAWDAILDDLSGLTQAEDKIPYFDSATTAALLDFVDEDDMASDSATGIPSQQSVKAYVDAEILSSGFNGALYHLQDQKAANTAGGTFTSGSWQKRTLNTALTSEISGASVASSVITLPAGTYHIEAEAAAYQANEHKLRLRNTSDSTTALIGFSERAASGDFSGNTSKLSGRVTIASNKNFELQHRCSNTSSTNGLGYPSNLGEVEVYADIKIWKVA